MATEWLADLTEHINIGQAWDDQQSRFNAKLTLNTSEDYDVNYLHNIMYQPSSICREPSDGLILDDVLDIKEKLIELKEEPFPNRSTKPSASTHKANTPAKSKPAARASRAPDTPPENNSRTPSPYPSPIGSPCNVATVAAVPGKPWCPLNAAPSCEEQKRGTKSGEKRSRPQADDLTLDLDFLAVIKSEDDPLGLFTRDPATLSPEEQYLLKKQKRLIKNRESAQLSRHRKKQHIETLQQQLDELARERTALQSRLAALSQENMMLKAQLAQPQSMVKTT